MVFLGLGDHGARRLVRSILSSRGPQDDQVSALELLDAQDREVRGLDQVAVGQQFPLNLVELICLQAGRRKDRLTGVIAILPDDDVAAAQVLEVVGEGTQGSDDGVRIPTRLVFDTVCLRPFADATSRRA